MKKIIIFSVLSIALVLGAFGVYKHMTKTKILSAHAKVNETFGTLDEMDQQTPIIVIGKKINEKPIVKNDDEGDPIYFYSLSDFEVEEIVKNTTVKEIVPNKNITILETAVFDSKKNELSTINGYKLMKKNKRYILYLNPNRSKGEEFSNVFNIAGVTLGKFSFEKNKEERKKIEKDESSALDEAVKVKREMMYNKLDSKYKIN